MEQSWVIIIKITPRLAVCHEGVSHSVDLRLMLLIQERQEEALAFTHTSITHKFPFDSNEQIGRCLGILCHYISDFTLSTCRVSSPCEGEIRLSQNRVILVPFLVVQWQLQALQASTGCFPGNKAECHILPWEPQGIL